MRTLIKIFAILFSRDILTAEVHMHANLLPESILIVRSADKKEITEALRVILFSTEHEHFTYINVVYGLDRSCRVLLVNEAQEAVSLPRPFSAEEMATELLRFSIREARYSPVKTESSNKGWEVRSAPFYGFSGAIVSSVWV